MVCNRHALPGKSRCELHGGKAWKRTDPASKHRYGKDWEARRARVLREEPNCRLCGTPATDVDHIVAHADGGTDDRSNLRSLCRDCHKQVTSEQNRARRKRLRQEKP
jgi:5-methylcytosine-specific restriction enzyme A